MDDVNKFIPFDIKEEDIIDTSLMDDVSFKNEYFSKVRDFNDNTSGKEFCYVLKLNDYNYNLENKINNSIICKRNNQYWLVIFERYLTKNDLRDIKEKYIPTAEADFDIVYEGGYCYRNQIKDRIYDKSKRLDLYR